MSNPGVTPGAVVRACVLLVVFGLALLYVRAGSESRSEFNLGAAAESADDWESAVLHYRHSVQWHAPGLGKSDLAFAALVRVGDERAEVGDVSGALVSYRSARFSAMAVRHLTTPFADELPDLHSKIAALMAEQSGGGSEAAERYAAELDAYEDRRPNPLLSLAASAGFFGWLAALGMLAWRGFNSEGQGPEQAVSRVAWGLPRLPLRLARQRAIRLMEPRTQASKYVWPLALCALTAVYLATSARFVLGGDNGEFATIFATGGVPHPSGYPAFAVYLRAMSWLPGVSPAHGASLATALLGIAAVILVRAACRAWGASLQASTLTAVTIGLSPLMWKLSTHAEVFALHALLAAGILRVTGPSARLSASRRAFLLGLLAGLGLANNHSLVTIAPLGFYGAYRVLIDSPRRLRVAGLALGGLCLGLSPYLYLIAVARSGSDVIMWGDTSSLSGLLHHFLRADYGTTQLAISEEGAPALAHISRLFVEMAKNLYYAPLAFALVGLTTLLGSRRTRRDASGTASASIKVPRLHESTVRVERTGPSQTAVGRRPSLPLGHGLAWLVTWICVGPVFIGMFNLPLEGLATVVVERFYLLPIVLLCVPISRGIDRVLESRLQAVEIYSPLCIGLLSLFIVTGLDAVSDHHREDVEYYLLNSLQTVEPDAVILGTGDHRIYGFHYVQRVLHQREDVTYIDPLLLNYPWYRAQIEARLGLTLDGVSDGSVDSVEVAQGLHAAGRSIYLTNRFSNAIVQSAPNYPIGTLIRIGAPPPPPTLEAMNASVAANYRYPADEPADPDGWAAAVNAEYTRPWRVLAQAYERMGDLESAERCRTHSVVIPRSP